MKFIADYDSDCKACFDNLLNSLLEFKNNNQINEFLYKPFDKVIINTNMEKDELLKKIIDNSQVEYKFTKFETISDSDYKDYKNKFENYTKSIFEK